MARRAGGSWTSITPALIGDEAIASLVMGESAGVLYVGTTLDLKRSGDGGSNWTSFATGLSAGVGVSAITYDANLGALFAGTMEGEIYRRAPAGGSWSLLGTTPVSAQVRPKHIVRDPATGSLYVGTGTSAGGAGIFRLF